MLTTAIRVLADQQRAADVHQDVFLAIWVRWHKFNGQTNWRGYLYRTTIRKAILASKALKTRSLDEIEMDQPGRIQQPDGHLKALELAKKLSELIAKLPQRQAEVFIMARLENLEYKEIADILGCSAETVRVHMHRAIKKLADGLVRYR